MLDATPKPHPDAKLWWAWQSKAHSSKSFRPTGGDAFFFYYHHVFTIHWGPLTVTAECLTALHAVCRISAAVPGFRRFLVNLRVDSAAISSSERSPSTIQPACCFCCSLALLAPNMSRPSCVYTRTQASHTVSPHTRSARSA